MPILTASSLINNSVVFCTYMGNGHRLQDRNPAEITVEGAGAGEVCCSSLHKCVFTALQVCAGEQQQSEPPEGLRTRGLHVSGKQCLMSPGLSEAQPGPRGSSVALWWCLFTV